MDNLKGDWEQLTGSIETGLIGLGEAANGPLRDLVQGATDLVNALSGAPDAVQGVTLALLGGGGLVLLGVAGMGKLTVGISEAKVALDALKISGRTATLAVAGVTAGLAIGALALGAWASAQAEAQAKTEAFQDTLDEFGETTDETLDKINDALTENRSSWLDSIFGKDAGNLIDQAAKFGLAVEDVQGYILGEAEAIEKVNAARENYVRAPGFSALVGALDSEASALTGAEKAAAAKAAADEAAGISAEGLAVEVEGVTAAAEAQIPTLEDLISLQAKAAGVVLSQREAEIQLQDSIRAATEALEKNGATLDITTEAGAANRRALDDIADSGWSLIESMQANGATQEELKSQMAASREAFINAATSMGIAAGDAEVLADKMGLIPEKVSVPVSVDTSGAARDVEALKAILRGIPNVVITSSMRNEGGYYANRAEGGIVYGPGTATSDSIDARLSNGEYVIKASSVNRYGKATFDDLNAQRFASGGYVGPANAGSASSPANGAGATVNLNVYTSDPMAAANAVLRRLTNEGWV